MSFSPAFCRFSSLPHTFGPVNVHLNRDKATLELHHAAEHGALRREETEEAGPENVSQQTR